MPPETSVLFIRKVKAFSEALNQFAFIFNWPELGSESPALQCRRSSFPESGRSAGEGTGYPLQYSWASLVAQLVKNLPAVLETWVQSLG